MRKVICAALLLATALPALAAPRQRAVRSLAHDAAAIQYRVDAGRTGVSAETGPQFLENVVWTRPMQGPVYGLVYDSGVLYAGALGAVYAVSPANGADVWVFSQPNVQFSPVALAEDEVYVSGGNVFYALDRATGAQLWSFDAGAPIAQTSPLIIDGVAYVGSEAGNVHAIDLASHAELWRRNVGAPVRTHIASAKNLLVVVTDDALRVLRIQNGAERWSLPGSWSPAITTDKRVYSGLEGGAFHALDLNTGKVEWTFADPNFPELAWGGVSVARGVVAVGNANGWFYLLHEDTGTQWRSFETNLINAEPIVGADGGIYFGLGSDPLTPNVTLFWSMDLNTGFERSMRFVYGNVVGGAAIANGVVFLHDSSNTLSALTD